MINKYLKTRLTWLWSFDCYLYSLVFPVIMYVINKERTITFYVIPTIIMALFGGVLNAFITERRTMKKLYDKYFNAITIGDAIIWISYFIVWIIGWVPDQWYPVAAAIMNVSTVQFSVAVREELKNRMFPVSEERTEFGNACYIAHSILTAAAGITLLLVGLKSFEIARLILVVAMVIDNAIMLFIHYRFEYNK